MTYFDEHVRYSRSLYFFKLWDGFRFSAEYQPVDEQASDEGEEEEVQVTEEGLVLLHQLRLNGGIGL